MARGSASLHEWTSDEHQSGDRDIGTRRYEGTSNVDRVLTSTAGTLARVTDMRWYKWMNKEYRVLARDIGANRY